MARHALGGDRDALDISSARYRETSTVWRCVCSGTRRTPRTRRRRFWCGSSRGSRRFDFQSRLQDWVYRFGGQLHSRRQEERYRAAASELRAVRRGPASGLEPVSADDAEQSLLIDEVKVGCSLAMLQCLTGRTALRTCSARSWNSRAPRPPKCSRLRQRSFEAAAARARSYLRFTRSHCGLVSDPAACRCHRRVSSAAVASFDVARPLNFARCSTSFQEARALVRQVDEARSVLALYRTSQPRASTIDFAQRLVSLMTGLSDSASEP